ncbi:MAG: trigger factor [Bacteroidia bacterium]|nr:trigger factor [Bacteroidia bacterium]
MELNFNKIDDLNATLTVALTKADYAESVEKELKKHQKNISVKGFRQGAAPMGMIKSIYGKSILVDEINKLASQSLYDYLKENNIDIIAQPLASETVASDVDIDTKEDYTFAFDLGLAPIFEFNISSKDSLDRFVISVDDAEVNKELETLQVRYGTMDKTDSIEEKDVVNAVLTELNDKNEPLDGGVSDKKTSFTPELITDGDLKNSIIGKKTGDTLTVDIFKLFNDNESVIASSLGLAKEAVKDLNKSFQLVVEDASRRIPAELNQELFDKVLGENVATDLDTFKAKIKENIEAYYKNESEQHVEHMIGHLLTEKHHVPLPDAFLKRWLISTKEENYNAENVDERYQEESKVLREILIREKAAKQFNVVINQEDIEQASLGYTLSMFRNYGLQNPEFEFVKKFSDDSLKKRDYVEQMNDIALRRKVYNEIKNIISYNDKPVTIEEFYKQIEAHNHQH